MRFIEYSEKAYVDNLRGFLGEGRRGFLRAYGLVPPNSSLGRVEKGYDKQALKALEAKVNQKIAAAEGPASTFAQRMGLYRDYLMLSDDQLGKKIQRSREAVRRWIHGDSAPKDMGAIADALNVPEEWLASGVESALPADSFIGLRVGDEMLAAKEALLGQVVDIVGSTPESMSCQQLQVVIETTVRKDARLSKLARRAGGRWQAVNDNGDLLFAPWDPLPEVKLTRRYWCDEVEAIIDEELAKPQSVYAAWHAMARRCETLKLEYPQLVSLHKRVERDRDRAAEYGVDLNAMIASSVAIYGSAALR